MPHASTLTRTHPGCGSGISRSTNSNGPPARGTWTARILAISADYTHAVISKVESIYTDFSAKILDLNHERLPLTWKNIDGSSNFCLDGAMKTKASVLTLAFCFWAGALCFAADPQVGTWKLNEAKSKFTPGITKNTMVVYEAAGDQVKVTSNGVDAKGKSTRSQWTGRFDGKNYPVTGDPNSDARSYKKINDRTLEMSIWNHGRVTGTGRIVVSADGKSRTVTTRGTTAKGRDFNNTAVFDKQ
jgi:hypothetical protein